MKTASRMPQKVMRWRSLSRSGRWSKWHLKGGQRDRSLAPACGLYFFSPGPEGMWKNIFDQAFRVEIIDADDMPLENLCTCCFPKLPPLSGASQPSLLGFSEAEEGALFSRYVTEND